MKVIRLVSPDRECCSKTKAVSTAIPNQAAGLFTDRNRCCHRYWEPPESGYASLFALLQTTISFNEKSRWTISRFSEYSRSFTWPVRTGVSLNQRRREQYRQGTAKCIFLIAWCEDQYRADQGEDHGVVQYFAVCLSSNAALASAEINVILWSSLAASESQWIFNRRTSFSWTSLEWIGFVSAWILISFSIPFDFVNHSSTSQREFSSILFTVCLPLVEHPISPSNALRQYSQQYISGSTDLAYAYASCHWMHAGFVWSSLAIDTFPFACVSLFLKWSEWEFRGRINVVDSSAMISNCINLSKKKAPWSFPFIQCSSFSLFFFLVVFFFLWMLALRLLINTLPHAKKDHPWALQEASN